VIAYSTVNLSNEIYFQQCFMLNFIFPQVKGFSQELISIFRVAAIFLRHGRGGALTRRLKTAGCIWLYAIIIEKPMKRL